MAGGPMGRDGPVGRDGPSLSRLAVRVGFILKIVLGRKEKSVMYS